MVGAAGAVFDIEDFRECADSAPPRDLNLPLLRTTPLAEYHDRAFREQIRLAVGFNIISVEVAVIHAHVRQHGRLNVSAETFRGRGGFLGTGDNERLTE